MTYQTKGTGHEHGGLAERGENVILEDGVRLFHPENIRLQSGVYVGHDTILEGYHRNELIVGTDTWVGPQCHFHAAGGIRIGKNVGIGPGVRILTSVHKEAGRGTPILHAPLRFDTVTIEDDADIGAGSTILPGVRIGRGAQVGAGALVSADIPDYAVAAGVPARVLRQRPDEPTI
ncbi:MAG: acetyltransferase-like isoleucine patch superfamily enzyme [Polyangiales bacterium]|jgi:acetyltransferase-like isoleucine patch superfamily enzyme